MRTVIVEDASRFARDLVTQELGILSLIGRGVRVVTASGDDLTDTKDHFKVAMRQIAGAFAQLEKARLVGELEHARDRKRRAEGKGEGRSLTPSSGPRSSRKLSVSIGRAPRRVSAVVFAKSALNFPC